MLCFYRCEDKQNLEKCQRIQNDWDIIYDFVKFAFHLIRNTLSFMTGRCLYISTFKDFLEENPLAVLGALHNNYHGESLTTTDEAWKGEIDSLR